MHRPKPATKRRPLAPRAHTVYDLGAGILLVFKPRGHRSTTHAHPYRQRVRVLRGQLRVRTPRRSFRLGPRSVPYILAANRTHDTFAVRDTWLVAERLASSTTWARAESQRLKAES